VLFQGVDFEGGRRVHLELLSDSRKRRRTSAGLSPALGRPRAPLHAKRARASSSIHLAAAIRAAFGDERAEPLPAEDDALAFEFLIRALHRDHANEHLLRELPERRQRIACLDPAFTNRALQPDTI
jgi:hypothetical protein